MTINHNQHFFVPILLLFCFCSFFVFFFGFIFMQNSILFVSMLSVNHRFELDLSFCVTADFALDIRGRSIYD